MQLLGIGMTSLRRPIGAIPPTTLENRVKRSITKDPTVGSRLNFFHEFPEPVFDGVAWNRYDTRTVYGRGHCTDNARAPGQRFITIAPTIGSRLNFFHEFPESIFNGVAWNRYDNPTASGRGPSTYSARERGQNVHHYGSDGGIALKFLS